MVSAIFLSCIFFALLFQLHATLKYDPSKTCYPPCLPPCRRLTQNSCLCGCPIKIRVQCPKLVCGFGCQVQSVYNGMCPGCDCSEDLKIGNKRNGESRTEIIGGPTLYISSGSTINLTCVVNEKKGSFNYLSWYHNGKAINHDTPRVISMLTERAAHMRTSRLLISNAQSDDNGNYSCVPSNAESVSVDLYVLKNTPVETDLNLPCSAPNCGLGCKVQKTFDGPCPGCDCPEIDDEDIPVKTDLPCSPPNCGTNCKVQETFEGPCPGCDCPRTDDEDIPVILEDKGECPECPKECRSVDNGDRCPECRCREVEMLMTPRSDRWVRPTCPPGCVLERPPESQCLSCLCRDETSRTSGSLRCAENVVCNPGCEVVFDQTCPRCDCPQIQEGVSF